MSNEFFEKVCGKITKAEFGLGGYNDAQMGLTLSFEGSGWGVGHFYGFWAGDPEENYSWDATKQEAQWGCTLRRLRVLLEDAKVSSVSALVGKPVEVTFNHGALLDFRILTEVL